MISEALRLLRVFNDMKSIELSKKLGISQSYLSEIERGKKTPTLDLLQKYGEVFNLKVSTLLFFSEELDKDKKNDVKDSIGKKMIKLLQIIEKLGGLEESENV